MEHLKLSVAMADLVETLHSVLRTLESGVLTLAADASSDQELALRRNMREVVRFLDWYRVWDESNSARGRRAADGRHGNNRAKKQHGRQIYFCRDWRSQWQAEHEIANRCQVSQRTAGNWVRSFKKET